MATTKEDQKLRDWVNKILWTFEGGDIYDVKDVINKAKADKSNWKSAKNAALFEKVCADYSKFERTYSKMHEDFVNLLR
jgi:hypothetical protein